MYRKNTASQFVHFQGVDATTGGIKSGVTWTMRRCIDGTFAAGGGTVTEDSTNGWYKCALTQADTNGNDIAFNFTGTGAVPQTVNIVTTAADPTDAIHFGLSALPNTACTTNASLLTSGTGTDQLSVTSGRIDIGKLLGTAWLTPGTAGTPDVNVKLWNALTTVALPVVPTVAGRTLDISAGGEAGVDWANVGSPTTSVNLSGTTTNLVNTVTTYTGNTVQTGDAYARIGAAGVGLTAVGLTGTQTFNNTGTWTGNIVGTLSTLTTYTGNTPQTGDSYARIGAAGAGLTALGDTRVANLDATVSSRLAISGYTAPPTAAQNATAVFTTALTESYAALHAAPTLAQINFEMRSLLAEKSVALTSLTAKKIDGSSTAGVYTLNDATSPTAITRAS